MNTSKGYSDGPHSSGLKSGVFFVKVTFTSGKCLFFLLILLLEVVVLLDDRTLSYAIRSVRLTNHTAVTATFKL